MYANSILALFTAGLAVVSAYTRPIGDEPKGNPIYQPGLNSVVPVGVNFTITWDPTTDGTVTLVLLKGPATNLEVQYPIVEKIENTGSYVWEPKTDLAPGETGYGIQLIVDATGQYQYTTQFGISNPDYKASSSTLEAYDNAPAYAAWTAPPAYHSTFAGTATPVVPGPASYPAGNSTIIQPTGTATATTNVTFVPHPSATNATATRSGIVVSTGAAGNIAANIGGIAMAACVAAFAF